MVPRSSGSKQQQQLTDLFVAVDHAVLAHVHSMLKAELIGHLPLGTLAEAHGQAICNYIGINYDLGGGGGCSLYTGPF